MKNKIKDLKCIPNFEKSTPENKETQKMTGIQFIFIYITVYHFIAHNPLQGNFEIVYFQTSACLLMTPLINAS